MVPRSPNHTSNFGVGAGSQTSGDLHATIYNHLFAPNSRTIDCHSGQGRIDSPNESAIVTARSYHPGGVNVLKGDGSVRFIKEGVSLEIWRALGTRRVARSSPREITDRGKSGGVVWLLNGGKRRPFLE